MLEKKWNNIAPEVPQDFHNKFEDTLKQIEQADSVDKKYKRKKISGRLLIAAAVICTGMAVTVAAKEFFKWNDYLVKRLDPSEEQQETLQESTYIQNIDQSVTQNGVTVTLTDSIQDQGFLYAFFEVKTEDSISMTDHTSFEEMTHFKIDGKEVYAVDDNRFGSFNTGVGQDVLLKTDQNSTHLKYFNACISYTFLLSYVIWKFFAFLPRGVQRGLAKSPLQSFYFTKTLSRCQISSTYSWIVLSDVNLPAHAVFSIAIRAQPFSSL